MSCPDCISGALITGEPTGYIDASGAYHAPAPSTASETQKTRSILLFTDAFGLPLNNCKLIADTLAARLACDVWVPDIFAGRPLIPLHLMLPSRSGEKIGFFRWLQFFWAMLFRVGNIFASRPSIADARALKFLDAVQKQKKYTKVGAVGYCFGGAMAVRMGARDVLQSAVVCHPAPFSTEQLKAIKIPTSWVFAEDDIFFKPAKRLEAEAVFAARKDTPSFIDYECRDYKGTTHGFASRPDLQYPEIKAAFENALDQIVGWFEKTIPVQ
ncbi:dienelactone hydrolase endo-1,3,1,4-beta-D-glucanase [Mycena belliarum]|uniref:Dienelactone hydrolase endo-1,3,1,4-beta-D-glucanase n=1 Tax=Mycena belliarum TaxID=1033014 RepID=A0AAD6XIT0_9AGAR|nr:dienelactone hydrolase endo-1,3,1,4-beta-D-glucanase [Mycena belliae]